MRSVVEDQDASVVSFFVWIAVGWIAESMSTSHLEVLAHGVVFLAVEMGFNEDVQFIVVSPVPIKCVTSKGGDVCNINLILSWVNLAFFEPGAARQTQFGVAAEAGDASSKGFPLSSESKIVGLELSGHDIMSSSGTGMVHP